MFCEGTAKSAAAAATSAAVSARLSANTASAVRPGVSAVHESATPYVCPVPGAVPVGVRSAPTTSPSSPETTGPCTVPRTVMTTSSPPLTLMVSSRRVSGSHSPSRRYVSSLIASMKKSVTSAPRFVRPHARDALCPMITPGKPAKEKPETSYGHASDTGAQRRPTWCQMLGAARPRWGSFARRGLPVAVRSPETTHEFEPVPSPRATVCGTAASAAAAVSTASCRDASPHGTSSCASAVVRAPVLPLASPSPAARALRCSVSSLRSRIGALPVRA